MTVLAPGATVVGGDGSIRRPSRTVVPSIGDVSGVGPLGSGAPPLSFNLTKGNTAIFRAAVAAGTAKVVNIGDSLDRGQSTGGGTSQFINGWAPQVANILQARGVNAGANNLWGSGACWGLAFTMANLETGDARVSHTGSWAVGGALCAGGSFLQCTAAGSMSFTPQNPVTNIDIYWRDNSTGRSFNWQVDGGATTQVDSTNVDAVRKISITGLALGSHTVTFNWVLGTPVILGVDAFDATASRKEISMWNWGASGFNSNQMVNVVSLASAQLNMMGTLQPALAFIEGGIYNDLQQSIPIATTQANIATLVDKQLTYGNAILRIPPWLQTFTQAQQAPYIAMFYDLAAQKGIGLVDITRKLNWTSWAAESAAGLVSDFVHPTAPGYLNQAQTYADVVQYAAVA